MKRIVWRQIQILEGCKKVKACQRSPNYRTWATLEMGRTMETLMRCAHARLQMISWVGYFPRKAIGKPPTKKRTMPPYSFHYFLRRRPSPRPKCAHSHTSCYTRFPQSCPNVQELSQFSTRPGPKICALVRFHSGLATIIVSTLIHHSTPSPQLSQPKQQEKKRARLTG